jgi:hypothetical protein
VAAAPNDEMLQSIRAGAPSDAFLDLVTLKVGNALGKVPPPSGARWTPEDIDHAAGDLIAAKWPKITAVVWNMENDHQLRSWVERVAVNVIADRGRETPRGRFTHRVKRIIGDQDDHYVDGDLVHGPMTGGIPAHDRDALLLPLWDIPVTTAWWQDPGDYPTPGDRADIVTLVRHVLALADGPVDIDLLVDVLAYRLNLSVGWQVGYLDHEVASTIVEEQDDIPAASAEAAARLLASLTEQERMALSLYADDPDVSTATVGAALGRSKSTGATVKSSLTAKLATFASVDPEAEAGVRFVGREILAGRFDPTGRSDPGRREETHAW